MTAVAGKDGKRLAPQTRLPAFNGDLKAKTVVRHTLADSLASANCRLPRKLATQVCPVVEKKQKQICDISKSSGAAGVVESSPPQIPEKEEVEARRVVSNSSVESDG